MAEVPVNQFQSAGVLSSNTEKQSDIKKIELEAIEVKPTSENRMSTVILAVEEDDELDDAPLTFKPNSSTAANSAVAEIPLKNGTVRGCHLFFCISVSVLLLAGGFWSFWVWTLLTLRHPEARKLIPDLTPNVFVISLCWVIPVLCGLWLICATIIGNGKKLSRLYFVVTSWLLILPITPLLLYHVVYLDKWSPSAVDLLLKEQMSKYAGATDALTWKELQTNFECCGVNGWKDWVDSDVLDGAVPPSCCRAGMKKNTPVGCPHEPSNYNTWSDGCSGKLIEVYSDFLITSIISLSCVTLFMVFSLFAAVRYYSFFERQTNPGFRFTCSQFWLDCIFPCCMKTPKTVELPDNRRKRKEPHRTTEHAYMHYVQHHGPPLTHKRQFASQFSIVKRDYNNN